VTHEPPSADSAAEQQRTPLLRAGLGARERRWLVIFLVLASAYVAFLLAERLLGVLGGFGTVLIILFLSWLLAFVISPLVAWLEARTGIGRPIVVIATYLIGLLVLGFLLFYTASAITQQVADLAEQYPETERGILATLAGWERNLEFGRARIDLTDMYNAAVGQLGRVGGEIVQQAQNIAGVTIAALGSLLLIIVLSVYMLVDSKRILARLRALVPRRYSDETDLLERSIVRAFGGFLRAQLILAAMQALLVAVVGTIFDIPYLFLWGTISAVAMLIPFFGPPLALLPPIVGALLFTGAGVPVAIILFVVQTVLVNWLQPRLMRGALGLHPILVLVGLLLGAQVAGVWGALFGIPVIAVVWVFVSYLVFRTLPNAALPEEKKLADVDEHVMVAVSREQVGDETHPHIHVTRRRRPDGTEQVELSMSDRPPARGAGAEDAPA
jgi:predicted PurR-regulated permease PerM